MCSPTTHPGSFRCSLHKNTATNNHHTNSYLSNRLNMRRSAMKNLLVRIGGDLACSKPIVPPLPCSSSSRDFETYKESKDPEAILIPPFSIDPCFISPNCSISNQIITKNSRPISGHKKTCMCSPTTHPDSFRCSLHKNTATNNHHADSYPSNRLNMRRSAMKNSLVRIGGDLGVAASGAGLWKEEGGSSSYFKQII
ncbi:hypothetical protein V8G54_009753 [Vigna mungo]|uniref:Uncharacterized protein n=1 Tax=Vigna mungo TaxID=3915 RepID=A0AAQ3S5S7_VIGMU